MLRKNGKLNLNRANGFDIFNYIFMAVIAIITFFPFYYVVIVSFANEGDVIGSSLYLYPTSLNFEAYRLIFTDPLFINAFLVSVFVTVSSVVLYIICQTAGGFVLSKSKIPGYRIMFAIIIIPMFFGGGLIPYYITIKNLGLMNNILVLILPGLYSTFNMILFKNFFQDLPQSLEESARIDGANDIVILFKIVIPTSTPIIATIALWIAVGQWNSWWSALMYISNPKLFPLQLVLREMQTDFQQLMSTNIGAEIARTNKAVYTKGLQMAVITVATIPILCIYPYLQKFYTKGIMLGAVKG